MFTKQTGSDIIDLAPGVLTAVGHAASYVHLDEVLKIFRGLR